MYNCMYVITCRFLHLLQTSACCFLASIRYSPQWLLDLKIVVTQDGFIYSSLYRKPSSGNTILHATSGHPYSLIKSIPYSQYIRLKRNCAQSADYEIAAKNVYNRLRDRGYSHKILKKAYNRAAQQDRQEFVFSTKTKTTLQPIRVVT